MALLFFIPSFFSLVTCFVAMRDKEIISIVVFGVVSLLFSGIGIPIWRGNMIFNVFRFRRNHKTGKKK